MWKTHEPTCIVRQSSNLSPIYKHYELHSYKSKKTGPSARMKLGQTQHQQELTFTCSFSEN